MATATPQDSNWQVNEDWELFIREKVNSFAKWDLVRFFHDNPYAADTAENIANYIGRDTHTILQELDELVSVGVLQCEKQKQGNIYRFSLMDDIRQRVTFFMQACHDRTFRAEAIRLVINGMHFSPSHDF